MPCKRCGKCCNGVIVPFIVDGAYWDYLQARGSKKIEGVGTWIPAKCRHYLLNLSDDKPYAKHLQHYCEIYAYRPKLCRVGEPVAGFGQWRPDGCTDEGWVQNEI